ncbi:uncharacterized protein [Dysidea avara]|uniref:uncharacterized protein n=1 Tax=Dysidea avara TaxID=196820 RepID=UPI0033275BE1
MNSLIFLLILASHAKLVTGVYFKTEWTTYIQLIIACHDKNTVRPYIISPSQFSDALLEIYSSANSNSMSTSDDINSPESKDADVFLDCDLPGVIIWDPILQFPDIYIDYKDSVPCSETDCYQVMKFLTWQDGSQQRYNPRRLYGTDGFVLLVCKIYRCPNGHLIATNDPRFLLKFKKRSTIPFFLLHRSGVTRELQYEIFHHCTLGISFADISKLLSWSLQTSWIRKISSKLSQGQRSIKSSEFNDALVAPMSNDLIINSFVITYNEIKDFLNVQMSDIRGEKLSCDHTFKLVSHIGIYRNGKWVPQYDSLFIMQNEHGKVLYWQLTMGTAYSAIRDGIENVKCRNDIKMIVIDNCCMWKNMLSGSLGSCVIVKLDLFHAVKRISTAISKKHPYFYQALQDFRLVFRSCGDNGVIRKMPTPPPDKLIKNLQMYLNKWSDICDHDSNPVLTAAVLKEINNVKIHISRGCLSGIPPHFGTNRNENLHRSLNSRFSGSRIGVEVAVALIAVFFHMWNSRHDGNETCTLAQYLMSDFSTKSDTLTPCEVPKFGIGVSSRRLYSIDNVTHAGKHSHGNTWDALQSVDQHLSTPNCEWLNEDMAYMVLHNALSLLHSEEVLNNLSISHAPVIRMIPFHDECVTMHTRQERIVPDELGDSRLKIYYNHSG